MKIKQNKKSKNKIFYSFLLHQIYSDQFLQKLNNIKSIFIYLQNLSTITLTLFRHLQRQIQVNQLIHNQLNANLCDFVKLITSGNDFEKMNLGEADVLSTCDDQSNKVADDVDSQIGDLLSQLSDAGIVDEEEEENFDSQMGLDLDKQLEEVMSQLSGAMSNDNVEDDAKNAVSVSCSFFSQFCDFGMSRNIER
eukprot:TRINITY_DN72175_c0_g1_i1.p2 TRINITY_DN72175_c0_g1~~TRINITY_DN72175_c0_g1_i1.p2  ORF type:complete len:210 (-),score=18.60 TRINITY_DN72175_c0_g1_i1:107-688(-)